MFGASPVEFSMAVETVRARPQARCLTQATWDDGAMVDGRDTASAWTATEDVDAASSLLEAIDADTLPSTLVAHVGDREAPLRHSLAGRRGFGLRVELPAERAAEAVDVTISANDQPLLQLTSTPVPVNAELGLAPDAAVQLLTLTYYLLD